MCLLHVFFLWIPNIAVQLLLRSISVWRQEGGSESVIDPIPLSYLLNFSGKRKPQQDVTSVFQCDPFNSVPEHCLGLPRWPANAGDARDAGLIPGSGRSPGGEHGYRLQYSYLENPMDRGAWGYSP